MEGGAFRKQVPSVASNVVYVYNSKLQSHCFDISHVKVVRNIHITSLLTREGTRELEEITRGRFK